MQVRKAHCPWRQYWHRSCCCMPRDACNMRMCLKKHAGRVIRTLDEWLCNSFAELIEEMELWKWDDATGDFCSRLAKALQQSNISVTWTERLDSRLASVHTTGPGKMSWAAATRSTRECKMRIEKIRVSHLDADSEVWGFDQTTWELMWAGEAVMRKSIPALKQAGPVRDTKVFPTCLREEFFCVGILRRIIASYTQNG